MKKCNTCHRIKPLTEFYEDDFMSSGYRNKCKECSRAEQRERHAAGCSKEYDQKRYTDPQWKKSRDEKARVRAKNHPEHGRAHIKVHKALKSKHLTRPDHCSQCGKTDARIEAHHPDYNKPLEIVWLCKRCHALANIGKIAITL